MYSSTTTSMLLPVEQQVLPVLIISLLKNGNNFDEYFFLTYAVIALHWLDVKLIN